VPSPKLDARQQMILFALAVVARPATNSELWELAGVRLESKDLKVLRKTAYLDIVKRGAVNVYGLTETGLGWCADAMADGRPEGTRFPAGVLYAVLNGLGTFLGRTETALEDVFTADLESWIRSVHHELVKNRRSGNRDVLLSKIRPWLVNVPQGAVDAELDRMITRSDVFLEAALKPSTLKEEDHKAAVTIGGEPRHLLRIEPK
jgi:hypothetical protein